MQEVLAVAMIMTVVIVVVEVMTVLKIGIAMVDGEIGVMVCIWLSVVFVFVLHANIVLI